MTKSQPSQINKYIQNIYVYIFRVCMFSLDCDLQSSLRLLLRIWRVYRNFSYLPSPLPSYPSDDLTCLYLLHIVSVCPPGDQKLWKSWNFLLLIHASPAPTSVQCLACKKCAGNNCQMTKTHNLNHVGVSDTMCVVGL